MIASLTSLRQTLTEWTRGLGLHPDQIVEMRTAAYEALANVVQHAYRSDHVGMLDLNAVCTPARDSVMVTVTDHGRWRPRLLDVHEPHGHGLQLIRALADHVDITTSPTGTTVTMAWTPRHAPPSGGVYGIA